MKNFDILIKNGLVPNFEDNSLNPADLAIQEGKIVGMGACEGNAQLKIDASGKVVSPGFIDIHMHEENLGLSDESNDFDIAYKMLRMGVTTAVGGQCGFSWGGIEETQRFIEFIKNQGAPLNYLLFAGYNSARQYLGIEDNYRQATAQERRNIIEVIEGLLDWGISGLSFGLEYAPGIDYKEMLSVCRSLDHHDLILSAHFREDGAGALASIEELIRLSKETQLPMEISHIGSCAALGYMEPVLSAIRKAQQENIPVDADCYPYNAFSTFIGSAVFDEGWRDRMGGSYQDLIIVQGPHRGEACNAELFHRLRKEHPETYVIASVMNEEEVLEAITTPGIMIASDGTFNKGQGHPRGAGTFPRVLGHYVRNLQALTLIEALAKMTFLPAKKLGLYQKGTLQVGKDADLVIFDPETIKDCATFDEPTLPPEGIDLVVVNGKVALQHNHLKDRRSGQFIHRNDRCPIT